MLPTDNGQIVLKLCIFHLFTTIIFIIGIIDTYQRLYHIQQHQCSYDHHRRRSIRSIDSSNSTNINSLWLHTLSKIQVYISFIYNICIFRCINWLINVLKFINIVHRLTMMNEDHQDPRDQLDLLENVIIVIC
jgi:hypothetical protein